MLGIKRTGWEKKRQVFLLDKRYLNEVIQQYKKLIKG